ncbi:LysM peptidoglycan-binding domain-containing protein [Micropruina sp.]|uniref:LysM peptidoglycan-binding domain-containing protein n=1 Tax=Micropruina sp. TaxID=2737536 RepID=UPI0039E4E726
MVRIRSIGAALALVVVVVGAPLALLFWGVPVTAVGNLARPDDGSALLALLTLAGWVARAVFAVSVVLEAVNIVGRRAVPLRLPLAGGLQAIAGALVFAALSPAVPAGAAPPVAAPASSGVEATGATQAESPTEVAGYLVRPGDDLWSVAEQVLGEGRHWRQLAEINPQLLANPTVDLVPGTRLVLPAGPEQSHHQVARAHTVVVERGDTLSGLAETHLGNGAKWPRIYRANADRIDDPDLIDVGWKLVIPQGKAAPAPQRQRPPRKPDVSLEVPQGEQPAPVQSATTAASPVAEPTATPTPTPTVTASAQAAPEVPAAVTTSAPGDPSWPLLGGLGGAAAAMILAGVGLSRANQLRSRPLGRRIAQPPVDLRRYETALGRRERPDSPVLLERALRRLGAHVHATGRPLPRLDRVLLDDVGVVFHWHRPPGEPPEPFQASGSAWLLSARSAASLPESTHPVPFPALVTLGREQSGAWLMVDLESAPPLALRGPRTLRHAAAAAMAVELSCSPWSAELTLTVVGGDEMFVRAACPELVRFTGDATVALDDLQVTALQRSDDEAPTALLRVDPDRAEAGAAQVILLADEPTADQRQRLDALFDGDLGISGVVAGAGSWSLALEGTEEAARATLEPSGQPLLPHLIAAHTRAAIGTIFAATDEGAHEPAHWWADQDSDNVRTLVPRRADRLSVDDRRPSDSAHPYLRLFGPIELVGAAGPAPARSRRQCEEYCGWLLENPGSTATRMTSELVVAETTRRSNMSRLRSWLGHDPIGQPYLPEAYSGRIALHPEVGSDWRRLQALIAPGLNRLTAETLVDVLDLVRGAPLADAAPGQWRWAEELRTDMASVARDAGVLLTRWAIEHRDLDLARWAGARALLAAPEDELLLVERIRTEHLAGNTGEVERLVRWVTGQARVLGIDLAPETVDACQQALEGRTRPRAVR